MNQSNNQYFRIREYLYFLISYNCITSTMEMYMMGLIALLVAVILFFSLRPRVYNHTVINDASNVDDNNEGPQVQQGHQAQQHEHQE